MDIQGASRQFVLEADLPASVAKYLRRQLQLSVAAFHDALCNGRVVVSLVAEQKTLSDLMFEALMTPIARLEFSDDRFGTLTKNGLEHGLGIHGRVFQYVAKRMVVKKGKSLWSNFGPMCRNTVDAVLDERLGIPKGYQISPKMMARIEAAMQGEGVG